MLNRLSPKTKKILSYPTIFFASFCIALSMHYFIIPNNFAAGGIGGIANMIQHLTRLSSGIFIFALNVPLVIMSFFVLGKELTFKSLLSIVTVSGGMILLKDLGMPQFKTDQVILASIGAGLLGGSSLAVIFKCSGTSGGTDFIAAAIHKKNNHINIIWFVFAMDLFVATLSIFVYKQGIAPALLSLAQMFINGRVCDGIMSGFKSAAKFEIITDKPDEVKQALFEGVGRGVTRIPAYGMYNNRDLSILMCVVRRSEIPKVQEVLRQFPGTFSIISETTDVYGQRFSSVHKGKSGL